MTPPRRRIAIVGYGTGGQACALAMLRNGHEVEVFERVVEPGPVGAGFLLQPTGLQASWQLGLLEAVRMHGAPVARLHGETVGGRAVMDMRYADLAPALDGLGMQRGALFELLHAAIAGRIRLHVDRGIVELDCEAGRLRDAHGHWHGPFDVVVVADGSGSALRGQVSPVRMDRPYPWGALWCLVPEAGWPWREELRQRYLMARNMVGMLPVGNTPSDPVRKLSFFWSLPIARFEHWQAAGRDAWLRQLEAIWPQARACLGPDFETSRMARAAYRDAIPQRWWHGRAVLLGDAAHAMSPQLGQGVNMALVDALALARQLEMQPSTGAAFTGYEAERKRHLAAYHRYSRWLTPLFQSHHDRIARVRDIAFLPAGRLPFARGHMLRVLAGVQQGWFGRYPLEEGFVDAMRGMPGIPDGLAEA
ncbi:MAG: FAD-dependent monooxygenase [Lysobacteraceae bacterium]|nr:MAG: FAD-dependent monooxygenase [Xanthomonadaceae bacterium]